MMGNDWDSFENVIQSVNFQFVAPELRAPKEMAKIEITSKGFPISSLYHI